MPPSTWASMRRWPSIRVTGSTTMRAMRLVLFQCARGPTPARNSRRCLASDRPVLGSAWPPATCSFEPLSMHAGLTPARNSRRCLTSDRTWLVGSAWPPATCSFEQLRGPPSLGARRRAADSVLTTHAVTGILLVVPAPDLVANDGADRMRGRQADHRPHGHPADLLGRRLHAEARHVGQPFVERRLVVPEVMRRARDAAVTGLHRPAGAAVPPDRRAVERRLRPLAAHLVEAPAIAGALVIPLLDEAAGVVVRAPLALVVDHVAVGEQRPVVLDPGRALRRTSGSARARPPCPPGCAGSRRG